MKMKAWMGLALVLMAGGAEAKAETIWAGNAGIQIEREVGLDCDRARRDAKFEFDSWARQRAQATVVCFEVYREGVTDNPRLYMGQKVDLLGIAVNGRTDNLIPYDIRGNNIVFALKLRPYDPFELFSGPVNLPPEVREVVVPFHVTLRGREVLNFDITYSR